MNQDSKNIFSAIITSVVTTVVVITLMVGVVMSNRGRVVALLGGNTEVPSVQSVAGDTAIMSAVEKANPAVVSIIVTKNEPVIERYYTNDPFGGFFNTPVPRYRQNGTQPQEVGGGSGFLVSADGLIATNAHVVNETDAEYTVYTNDGKKHSAKVVATDDAQDIALLKIDQNGETFPFLSFGSSENIKLGQTVIAIGNALGEYRNTVSAGVVSGLSRSIVAGDFSGATEQLDEVIQTDAAINPGNSGGPLLDIQGNVIGMNVAVAITSQNIGFALPGDVVKKAVESVKAKGYISRPFLGIRYVAVTPQLKEQQKLSVDYGVLVTREGSTAPATVPGSPAEKAGIVADDIILEFDGVKLDDTQKLSALVLKKNAGDTVTVKFMRKGTVRTLRITLGEYNNVAQ